MKLSSETYQVDVHELDAGRFVEVFDVTQSKEEPVIFIPASDAEELAEAILGEVR